MYILYLHYVNYYHTMRTREEDQSKIQYYWNPEYPFNGGSDVPYSFA